MGNGTSSNQKEHKRHHKRNKHKHSPQQSRSHSPEHAHYRKRSPSQDSHTEEMASLKYSPRPIRSHSINPSPTVGRTQTHGMAITDSNRIDSMEPKDVMISYSHQDKDIMRKIKSSLENEGITVWVDETDLIAGAEFLSKIGQAIIDAKLFLSIMSPISIESRYCKDELALAYVSSKPIYPCALTAFNDLTRSMDFGMRLQLAPLQWTMFTDERSFNDAFLELKSSLLHKLNQLKDGSANVIQKVVRTATARTRINAHNRQVSVVSDEEEEEFWGKNFGDAKEVPWNEFKGCFEDFVQSEFQELRLPKEWLLSVLAQEVDEDGDQVVSKNSYLEFITIDGEEIDFKTRVKEQALETYTMHQVFNMESTVRLDAIENLSKFKSMSVIEALLDLCVDTTANVRAVAAISLARAVDDSSNKRVVRKLMQLLNDGDRLVRQAGCLALGHIKATEAVGRLVNIWRNDFISTVREAAEIALKNIGGEEAKKAIHITNVLADEIKALATADD